MISLSSDIGQLGIEILFWVPATIGAIMLVGILAYLYRNGWDLPGDSRE